MSGLAIFTQKAQGQACRQPTQRQITMCSKGEGRYGVKGFICILLKSGRDGIIFILLKSGRDGVIHVLLKSGRDGVICRTP
jgi:hypothetical protein